MNVNSRVVVVTIDYETGACKARVVENIERVLVIRTALPTQRERIVYMTARVGKSSGASKVTLAVAVTEYTNADVIFCVAVMCHASNDSTVLSVPPVERTRRAIQNLATRNRMIKNPLWNRESHTTLLIWKFVQPALPV